MMIMIFSNVSDVSAVGRSNRCHGVGRGAVHSLQPIEELWGVVLICGLCFPLLVLHLPQLSLDFTSEKLETDMLGR